MCSETMFSGEFPDLEVKEDEVIWSVFSPDCNLDRAQSGLSPEERHLPSEARSGPGGEEVLSRRTKQ